MYWQNRSIFLFLIIALQADALYRDPFVPLYMKDPRGEYERRLKVRAQDGRNVAVHPEMFLCRTAYNPEIEPFVVLEGQTYRENDKYNYGIIKSIDCDFMTIVSGRTIMKIALYDQRIVQKVSEESIDVSSK